MRHLSRIARRATRRAISLLAAAASAASPSPYPLDLSTAIGNAYGGELTGIQHARKGAPGRGSAAAS